MVTAEGVFPKTGNDPLYDSEINFFYNQRGIAYNAAGKNLIRQLHISGVNLSANGSEWAEGYTDSTGRLNSVVTGSTTALFDSDKYITMPYVIIEAGSAEVSWTNNDCNLTNLSDGKWRLDCDTGTEEVRRAQIYKSLFYGTDGTDQLILDFGSVTRLATNISRDVGKVAYYMHGRSNGAGAGGYYNCTFEDTTNNTKCSSWSFCYDAGVGGGTDETGTDKTADEYDNPANCYLEVDDGNNVAKWFLPSGTLLNSEGGSDSDSNVKAFLLCTGSLTIVSGGGLDSPSNAIDFFAEHSIPELSKVDYNEYSQTIFHTIPNNTFSSTIGCSQGTFLAENWVNGSSNCIYKLTNGSGDDSGWQSGDKIASFTQFTAQPTFLTVSIDPISGTLAKTGINGFALYEMEK